MHITIGTDTAGQVQGVTPRVVICGATGVGKTTLARRVARHMEGTVGVVTTATGAAEWTDWPVQVVGPRAPEQVYSLLLVDDADLLDRCTVQAAWHGGHGIVAVFCWGYATSYLSGADEVWGLRRDGVTPIVSAVPGTARSLTAPDLCAADSPLAAGWVS